MIVQFLLKCSCNRVYTHTKSGKVNFGFHCVSAVCPDFQILQASDGWYLQILDVFLSAIGHVVAM